MKAMVFDSSSLISISMNDLLWTLPALKEKFDGEILITESVKNEVINVPIKSKRFKLEAIQLLSIISRGIIKIYKGDDELRAKTRRITDLINNIYMAKDTYIKIVQLAEIESLILSNMLDSTLVIDERTTRMLVEDPKSLARVLAEKLHTDIRINEKNLSLFNKEVHKVQIIRSAELMTVAYKKGIMNVYLNQQNSKIINIDLRRTLLDGLLWGLRLRGCSISSDEINGIMMLNGF